MSMSILNAMNGRPCSCGKIHAFSSEIISGCGCLRRLPEVLRSRHAEHPFVLSDCHTWQAAGEAVCGLLRENGIPFSAYCFPDETLEPDEKSVGSAVMHMDFSCDLILAVGSGVLNDIGKILSSLSHLPYIIVATAPSMDGYASASSSMTRDGLKISLPTRSADVIIGDTDILRQAPQRMLISGLGDMIAKYVSICEWRISHLITGEYYCEEIAQLIRSALQRCVDNAQGILRREEEAVQAVFEGLVIGGVAMNYAGLSRPASGMEHYISHVLDMRGAAFGTPVDFHGIQCAIGTLIALRLYEKMKNITPDRAKALDYAERFDFSAWSEELRTFLGKGAEAMIALEAKENKYDPTLHAQRLEIILNRWPEILQIMDEELPSSDSLEQLLTQIGVPKALSDIGVDNDLLPMIVCCTKDIRDKYVLSRLAWDLGVLDDILGSK
ncbi:MAG: sn-glycerol-1-phosphate dehydrogenase [Faecousia sp.]